MFSSNARKWIVGTASATILMSSSFAAYAGSPHAKTNINLAVASNFYGFPPSNSAITDLINAFEAENPGYTVTVVDNGATETLEQHIIDGNALGVDLFLAADTDHPQDLLTNHFNLVTPYNFPPSSPKLFIFNYAQGILALLSNTPDVDVSCDPGGSCGYVPPQQVAIADPSVAPYGVAAQTVLTGRYAVGFPLPSFDGQIRCRFSSSQLRSQISQYHGNLQCGHKSDRAPRICGNVSDLFRGNLSNTRKRNKCAGLLCY